MTGGAIAPRRAAAIVPARGIEMSARLRSIVQDLVEPTRFGLALPPRAWAEEERAEAAALVTVAEARCGGATTREHVDAWVSELLGARLGRPPQDDAALDAYIDLVALTFEDLPAGVWGAEALKAGLRTWKWWPSTAEVGEVVEPVARRLIAERDALRRVAAPPAPPALPAPSQLALPAPEDRPATADYVAGVLAKWGYRPAGGRGDAATRAPAPREPAPPPRPLSPAGQARAAAAVTDLRAGVRLRYEEMARSADPEQAAAGRDGLAAMDRAAARTAAAAAPRA